MPFWVYIVTNKPRGVLYVGVTNDLARRAWEHRTHRVRGFTDRYNCEMLVFAGPYDQVIDAIQREKNIKHWLRAWKIELIESVNPNWDDLYPTLAGTPA